MVEHKPSWDDSGGPEAPKQSGWSLRSVDEAKIDDRSLLVSYELTFALHYHVLITGQSAGVACK
jgi:hypothetical protein